MASIPMNPATAPTPAVTPLMIPDPFPDPEWDPPPLPTGMIEEDGEPMESIWHRINTNLLTETIEQRFRDRRDFFVGGNMFLYFCGEQVRRRDYRGPDFFFVDDVPHEPLRRWWAIWEEGGRYPDVIAELLSPTTKTEDVTVKKALYEKTFRTPEYFCYDTDTRELQGWRLSNGEYLPIRPNEKGWLWSEKLGLWLGTWDGDVQNHEAKWLRFFYPNGDLVLTFAEAENLRAETEKQHAETEKQHADAAEQRADALAAELARLKTQLASHTKPQP